MRGWLKQGTRIVLSIVTSMALIAPSISSAEVVQEPPSAMAMMGDALFVRPLLLIATAAGTVTFVFTLPFSALGGNTKEAASTLIGTPAEALFLRCLGCTEQEDEARDIDAAQKKKEQQAVDAAAAEAAAAQESAAAKP